jgi:hypothetical protein
VPQSALFHVPLPRAGGSISLPTKKSKKYENDHHTFQPLQKQVQPPLGAGPGEKTFLKI